MVKAGKVNCSEFEPIGHDLVILLVGVGANPVNYIDPDGVVERSSLPGEGESVWSCSMGHP
jgi:hypothetical protein